MSADCLIWIVALYLASLLRLDFNVSRVQSFRLALLFIPAVALQIVTGWWTGLYRGWWINGSFEEVAALARATVISTLGLAAIDLLAPGDPRPAPISAVIAIGDSLNLDVVAEGIERTDQIVSLQNLGCEFGQGFLFARPMSHEALFEYLIDEGSAERPESNAA